MLTRKPIKYIVITALAIFAVTRHYQQDPKMGVFYAVLILVLVAIGHIYDQRTKKRESVKEKSHDE